MPPSAYGTFLTANDDGTVDVFSAGRKMRVSVHPEVDLDALAQGLGRAQAIRASLARRDRAGLARLAEIFGKSRLVVVPELDDEVGDRGAIDHLIDALFRQ